jgi:hypothetical protein
VPAQGAQPSAESGRIAGLFKDHDVEQESKHTVGEGDSAEAMRAPRSHLQAFGGREQREVTEVLNARSRWRQDWKREPELT